LESAPAEAAGEPAATQSLGKLVPFLKLN